MSKRKLFLTIILGVVFIFSTAFAADQVKKSRGQTVYVQATLQNFFYTNTDDLVKSRKCPFSVIPSKAGI